MIVAPAGRTLQLRTRHRKRSSGDSDRRVIRSGDGKGRGGGRVEGEESRKEKESGEDDRQMPR